MMVSDEGQLVKRSSSELQKCGSLKSERGLDPCMMKHK